MPTVFVPQDKKAQNSQCERSVLTPVLAAFIAEGVAFQQTADSAIIPHVSLPKFQLLFSTRCNLSQVPQLSDAMQKLIFVLFEPSTPCLSRGSHVTK
jgi:hypothetical protein